MKVLVACEESQTVCSAFRLKEKPVALGLEHKDKAQEALLEATKAYIERMKE